jgi:hypothetical protein
MFPEIKLTRYIENGQCYQKSNMQWEIDNNLVENSIRPVALGRKNYIVYSGLN